MPPRRPSTPTAAPPPRPPERGPSQLPLDSPTVQAALLEVTTELTRKHGLSSRETEVFLAFVSRRSLDKEIAAELGISYSTVKQYWVRICGKLGREDHLALLLELHVEARARSCPCRLKDEAKSTR